MFWLLSFALFYVLAKASCDDLGFGENVVTLTDDNFQEFIDSHEYVLVMFYAPWCGYSRSLAPEFGKAADKLAEEKSDIVLAKVNAIIEPRLDLEYAIKGYPTVVLFHDGKTTEYEGQHTADHIVAWLKPRASSRRRTAHYRTLDKGEESDEVATRVAPKKRKRQAQKKCLI